MAIIRNMAFSLGNRAAMLASDELMYVLKNVITDGTADEQLMAVTCVWKLVANNFKGKHAIRNGTLMAKLNGLISNFEATSTTTASGINIASDMTEALDAITVIFSK